MSLVNLGSLSVLNFSKGTPGSSLSISAPSAVLFANGDQPYAMGDVWPPANTVLYIDFDAGIYYWDGAFKTAADLTDNGDGTYDLDLSTALDAGNLAGFIEVTNNPAPHPVGVAFDFYDSATGLKRFEVFSDVDTAKVRIFDNGTVTYTDTVSENGVLNYLSRRVRTAWSYTAGSPRLTVQNNGNLPTNSNAVSITGCDRIGIGYRRHYDNNPLAGTVNKVCLIDATLTETQLRAIIEYSDRTYGDFWVGDSYINSSQIRLDLADIRGTSSYYFSGQYGVGGTTLTQQATDFTTNQSRHYDKTLIICEGLEYASDPTGATSIAAIASMVAELSHDRWVYVQSNPQEATGTGNRDDFDSCDAAIRAYVGETHYVETLPGMQAANDGSANDLADVANDIWPRSLRSDSVHLNAAGNDVMAQIIYNKLVANGWHTKTTSYIQFADTQYDSGDDAYTATIVSSDSLLDFTVATSTPPTVTGDASDSVTLEGTLSAINAALRGPTIDNKAVGAGTLTLTITHDTTGRTASKTISVGSVAELTSTAINDSTAIGAVLDTVTSLPGATYSIINADQIYRPVISNIVAAETSDTTATIDLDIWLRETTAGTLWWYVGTSATRPSVTDLKAGTGAADSGNQAISNSGTSVAEAQSQISVTGLSASTAYYVHVYCEDANGASADIASRQPDPVSFTTEASSSVDIEWSTNFYTGPGTPYARSGSNNEVITRSDTSVNWVAAATNVFTSGRIYAEIEFTTDNFDAAGSSYAISIIDSGTNLTNVVSVFPGGAGLGDHASVRSLSATGTATGSWSSTNAPPATEWVQGDVLMVDLDIDNGVFRFGRNGTWYASGAAIATDGTPNASGYAIALSLYDSGNDSSTSGVFTLLSTQNYTIPTGAVAAIPQ